MQYTTFVPLALAALAQANLDKPPLTDNLDYLEDGQINALQPTQSTFPQWEAGYMPKDCYDIANNENTNPADYEIYNVTYTDCSDPWILCRHKDSQVDLVSTIDIFGRLPVRMRDYVRHILTIPADGASAYNSNGNIAFFGTAASSMDVAIHESGHSLDLQGAYTTNADDGHTLSSSQQWLDAYNADSNVPDGYAGTNQVENVAQNTVVASYDKNVQGGFCGVQSNCAAIQHQYQELESTAGDLIIPGGTCDRKLQNSDTVKTDGSAAQANGFAVKYTNVQTGATKQFSTKGMCKFH